MHNELCGRAIELVIAERKLLGERPPGVQSGQPSAHGCHEGL